MLNASLVLVLPNSIRKKAPGGASFNFAIRNSRNVGSLGLRPTAAAR